MPAFSICMRRSSNIVRPTNRSIRSVIVNTPAAAATGDSPDIRANAQSPARHLTSASIALGDQSNVVIGRDAVSPATGALRHAGRFHDGFGPIAQGWAVDSAGEAQPARIARIHRAVGVDARPAAAQPIARLARKLGRPGAVVPPLIHSNGKTKSRP